MPTAWGNRPLDAPRTGSLSGRTLRNPGCRFPAEAIVVAARRYLRFNLSYRDVEELLVERGVEVDHVTIYQWV
ncbi:hypothetical protein GCM10010199_70730 [Dactylosporangium roseum]